MTAAKTKDRPRGIHFRLEDEYHDKLNRVREHCSKTIPGGQCSAHDALKWLLDRAVMRINAGKPL